MCDSFYREAVWITTFKGLAGQAQGERPAICIILPQGSLSNDVQRISQCERAATCEIVWRKRI
jgi:hypothetical protein